MHIRKSYYLFHSVPQKQLQGSRSVWLNLCYQDPSARTAHVWECMLVGSHMTPPHLPSLLLPDPVNSCPCLQCYFSKGTNSKNCIKPTPVFGKKKKPGKKFSVHLKIFLIYLFFFCKEKNVETQKEKGFKGSAEMQIVSFSKLS